MIPTQCMRHHTDLHWQKGEWVGFCLCYYTHHLNKKNKWHLTAASSKNKNPLINTLPFIYTDSFFGKRAFPIHKKTPVTVMSADYPECFFKAFFFFFLLFCWRRDSSTLCLSSQQEAASGTFPLDRTFPDESTNTFENLPWSFLSKDTTEAPTQLCLITLA